MVAWQGEQHGVLEQPLHAETGEVVLAPPQVGALVGEGESDVDLAGPDQGERLRRLDLVEPDRDPGVAFAQDRERPRHERRRRRRKGREPDQAGLEPGDRDDLGLGGAQRCAHALPVPGEHLPGLGETDRAAGPDEQRCAEPTLEALHVLTHRGLTDPEMLGRSRERALVSDRLHETQGAQVDSTTGSGVTHHGML